MKIRISILLLAAVPLLAGCSFSNSESSVYQRDLNTEVSAMSTSARPTQSSGNADRFEDSATRVVVAKNQFFASYEEIARATHTPFVIPATLPPGYELGRIQLTTADFPDATGNGRRETVVFSYRKFGGGAALLSQTPERRIPEEIASLIPIPRLPESALHGEVFIRGQRARWYQGNWRTATPSGDLSSLRWEPDGLHLKWAADGMDYEITGIGPTTLDDMLQLANSLR